MFGFGKKDKNKVNANIIYNLDDQPVLDRSTGEFLMDFDFEQRKILRFLLDYNVEIRSFAYKGLPAEYMAEIKNFFVPENSFSQYANNRDFDENAMYRLVHTDLDLEQFGFCITALNNGVDMCGEIDNITSYPISVFESVSHLSEFGINFCKEVSPGMDYHAFGVKVGEAIKKHYKKEEQRRKNEKIQRFFGIY